MKNNVLKNKLVTLLRMTLRTKTKEKVLPCVLIKRQLYNRILTVNKGFKGFLH